MSNILISPIRLIAVVESLDNGKPIRETRDYDIPIVIRHLYHHAGWAQLMDTEMAGRNLSVVVQIFQYFDLVSEGNVQ